MFDSIGRKGRTKPLSSTRWLASAFIGFLMMGMMWATTNVVQSMPEKKKDDVKEVTEVTFTKFVKPPPPPPPPPPPRKVPKSTTKPRRNVLTTKVVEKEIEKPTPTPIPEPDAPTPEPEIEMAMAGDLGMLGGVEGGVVGGVIGGVLGATGDASSQISEVNADDLVKLRHVNPVYPPLAKRNRITSQVLVEVHVGKDGSVTSILWLRGNEIFKEAVESAVRQWKFAPQPIPARFQQPFNFALKG